MAAEPPIPEDVARAVVGLRARTAIAQLGAERLALQVAIRCGVEGVDPDQFFGEPGDLTPASLHTFARSVLAPDRRAVVSVEVKP